MNKRVRFWDYDRRNWRVGKIAYQSPDGGFLIFIPGAGVVYSDRVESFPCDTK